MWQLSSKQNFLFAEPDSTLWYTHQCNSSLHALWRRGPNPTILRKQSSLWWMLPYYSSLQILKQIFSYAPKSVESWKGQKLLPRAEFHLGAHVNKFLRLQMLPTPGSARSNRFAVIFGTLDGGIDFLAPVDELTFRRLQTLQRKLVDCVSHVAGLNPRAFRQFRCDGKAHRPGPDNIVDCELLSQ